MRVQTHRKLTDPFVQGAVALMSRTDRSVREVAEGLGISTFTLRRWYNELVTKKKRPSRREGLLCDRCDVSALRSLPSGLLRVCPLSEQSKGRARGRAPGADSRCPR